MHKYLNKFNNDNGIQLQKQQLAPPIQQKSIPISIKIYYYFIALLLFVPFVIFTLIYFIYLCIKSCIISIKNIYIIALHLNITQNNNNSSNIKSELKEHFNCAFDCFKFNHQPVIQNDHITTEVSTLHQPIQQLEQQTIQQIIQPSSEIKDNIQTNYSIGQGVLNSNNNFNNQVQLNNGNFNNNIGIIYSTTTTNRRTNNSRSNNDNQGQLNNSRNYNKIYNISKPISPNNRNNNNNNNNNTCFGKCNNINCTGCYRLQNHQNRNTTINKSTISYNSTSTTTTTTARYKNNILNKTPKSSFQQFKEEQEKRKLQIEQRRAQIEQSRLSKGKILTKYEYLPVALKQQSPDSKEKKQNDTQQQIENSQAPQLIEPKQSIQHYEAIPYEIFQKQQVEKEKQTKQHHLQIKNQPIVAQFVAVPPNQQEFFFQQQESISDFNNKQKKQLEIYKNQKLEDNFSIKKDIQTNNTILQNLNSSPKPQPTSQMIDQFEIDDDNDQDKSDEDDDQLTKELKKCRRMIRRNEFLIFKYQDRYNDLDQSERIYLSKLIETTNELRLKKYYRL